MVGAFRADAARAGASAEIRELVTELCALSPDFAALWRANDVNAHGGGVKRLLHPVLGRIALEFSTFSVDGRPDLGLLVYTATEPALAARIRALAQAGPPG